MFFNKSTEKVFDNNFLEYVFVNVLLYNILNAQHVYSDLKEGTFLMEILSKLQVILTKVRENTYYRNHILMIFKELVIKHSMTFSTALHNSDAKLSSLVQFETEMALFRALLNS